MLAFACKTSTNGTHPIRILSQTCALCMKIGRVLFTTACLLLTLWSAAAQVPGVISHQGKLLANGTNYSGSASFKFALVDKSGMATYWSHDGTSFGGREPSGSPITLPVNLGLFSVGLGDTGVPNMNYPIPSAVFLNKEVFLRTWVNDGAHEWELLAPDRRVWAAGYALVASRLAEPADNALTAITVTGPFSGDVTGTQHSTVVSRVGGTAAGEVSARAADVASATPANVPSTLVRRDSSGGFTAGTISGTFAGDGSALTGLNAAQLNGGIPSAVIEASLPVGFTVVSLLPEDPSLTANGYRRMMSIPAPPWSNGSGVNTPSARAGHSTLWDGRRLLVWGGTVGPSAPHVNTGAMYLSRLRYLDPDFHNWRARTSRGPWRSLDRN